jgi:hypothetical protein
MASGKNTIEYDGMLYPDTPRARSWIDAAEKIKFGLPLPEEGTTRLWRGNRPDEVGKNPSYTNSLPGIALPFLGVYGGDLSYVDVPSQDLGNYVNNGGTAPNSEFILPADLVSEARIAATPPTLFNPHQ